MSMHTRDSQTSDAKTFIPKSHVAILLTVSGTYTFEDRQSVSFDVIVASGNTPFYLPVSVNKMTDAPTPNAAIFIC